MAGWEVTLSEAKQQVSRVVDQLEAVHWQLVGIALSLPETAAANPMEDLDGEPRAEVELRRVIECVLADRIRVALGDLRSVLPSTGEAEET